MTVIQFPNKGKEDRLQITEIKEHLVEDGIFKDVSSIPTNLVIFMIQFWQEIYDAGYIEGLYKEANEK